MKKQNLKNLKLNKKSISTLGSELINGGAKSNIVSIHVKCPFGPTDDTLDFDCNNSPSLNPCGN